MTSWWQKRWNLSDRVWTMSATSRTTLRAAGFELRAIQNGLEPSDWKPMRTIGSGVREIRIHVLGEWRVIYVAKLKDAVYVLHAFQNKGRRTSPQDIDLARRRYRQIGGKS